MRRLAPRMGTSDEPLIADFLIICTNVLKDEPRVFVLPGTEAARLVQASGTGSKLSCWLEPAAYEPFEDAWQLIGTGYGL
jgi:hypothetical protein